MKRAAGLAGGMVGILIACAVSGFVAFAFMGIFAGFGTGIFPDFHYNLIADRICPPGTTFKYSTEQVESFDGTSSVLTTLHCYDAAGNDQAGTSTLLAADAMIWGGYFALCFIPLFLVLLLFGGALLALAGRLFRRGQSAESGEG